MSHLTFRFPTQTVPSVLIALTSSTVYQYVLLKQSQSSSSRLIVLGSQVWTAPKRGRGLNIKLRTASGPFIGVAFWWASAPHKLTRHPLNDKNRPGFKSSTEPWKKPINHINTFSMKTQLLQPHLIVSSILDWGECVSWWDAFFLPHNWPFLLARRFNSATFELRSSKEAQCIDGSEWL